MDTQINYLVYLFNVVWFKNSFICVVQVIYYLGSNELCSTFILTRVSKITGYNNSSLLAICGVLCALPIANNYKTINFCTGCV